MAHALGMRGEQLPLINRHALGASLAILRKLLRVIKPIALLLEAQLLLEILGIACFGLDCSDMQEAAAAISAMRFLAMDLGLRP